MNNIKSVLFKLPNIKRKLKYPFYLKYYRFIFNLLKIKHGKNLRIYNKIYLNIDYRSKIEIGDNFLFTNDDAINPLCRNIRGCINATKGSKIFIGNNVGISSACIWAKESITIKDNVKIGGDCIIMDTDAHNLDYKIRSSNLRTPDGMSLDVESAKSKPIVIENNVLIGTRCIILKGVTIGARSIIGSGSVVTKSIPADCIAAGNPCKVIRYINSEK